MEKGFTKLGEGFFLCGWNIPGEAFPLRKA